MSENNESHQAQAGAQAPRVARSASSQPLSGTEQSQAHENMAAASGGVKVREKERRGAPRARRMSLSLTRIDAWSAAKVAFMLSIAGGIIQIVAVTLLWLLLNVVGVFDQVTQIVSSTGLDAGGFDLANVLSTKYRSNPYFGKGGEREPYRHTVGTADFITVCWLGRACRCL